MEKRRKRDSGGASSLMGDMRGFGAHHGGHPPSLSAAGLGGPASLLGSSIHDWPVPMMSSSSSSYLSSHAAGYHHHSPGPSAASAVSAYLPHSSAHNPHLSPAAASSSSYLPPYSASYHPSYHSTNLISDPHSQSHQGLLPDLQVGFE